MQSVDPMSFDEFANTYTQMHFIKTLILSNFHSRNYANIISCRDMYKLVVQANPLLFINIHRLSISLPFLKPCDPIVFIYSRPSSL